ncbi:F0F1 ATP synthase subunit delta [Vibrio astriarenae]|jgi:F-type H+-transporting ATPase subunit delta|uniref:ATP synthase subunit delta n=1 Tax=Vibrio agarivorans TaxID=153622 RepID=A0ABT7Y355_9VIBR|nr:F0F1 ATP synthase subunit delta [Vibrio agarivorans]MDN2482445.1 F0F1 ATP synthase subunit delta [Vibrio agarivorans]MDN3661989.1 F0F1 ATP synthase subunit delta [Vibrio agarivorans]
MSDLTTIARPYAKAAYGYASDNGAVEKWSEMLAFAKEMSLVKELKTAALSLQPEQLVQLYVDVAGEQFDEHFQNFLKVIIENHRTSALSDIYQQYTRLTVEASNSKEVSVITAFAMTEAQMTELTSSLEKRLDCKVQLVCTVDEELIGGAVIRIGDTVLDNSLVSRLTRLKDTIQS